MTLAWSSSINKKSPPLHNVPASVKVKLDEVWQKSYAELYEPTTNEATSLQDTVEEVLELFQDQDKTLVHLRHVWMALILAVVVEPTIKYYQPENTIPDQTIEKMSAWLLKTIKAEINSEIPFDFDPPADVLNICSVSAKQIEEFQTLHEVLNVYTNAIKTLNPKQSLEALIDILDDCLEGYAVFPGSYGRRELFNWWLLDVVPATWNLLPPSSMYAVESLPNRDNIRSHQMKILQAISFRNIEYRRFEIN